MGLLTILKKMREREKELRLLMLWAELPGEGAGLAGGEGGALGGEGAGLRGKGQWGIEGEGRGRGCGGAWPMGWAWPR